MPIDVEQVLTRRLLERDIAFLKKRVAGFNADIRHIERCRGLALTELDGLRADLAKLNTLVKGSPK